MRRRSCQNDIAGIVHPSNRPLRICADISGLGRLTGIRIPEVGVLGRRIRLVLLVVVLLVVAGCTDGGEASGFGCESATEDQRHSVSDFPLSVSENPVFPGAPIDLNIGSTTTRSDTGSGDASQNRAVTSYGSTWQCWTGSAWVDTHLLVHNGETLAGQPGATTTVPAIGLPVPESFSIVVPSVDPGWYRITVRIWVDRPDASPIGVVGFVSVEVLG